MRTIFYCLTREIDILHMGDGVMTPMGYILKLLTGKKVTFTAYGKDINLKMRFYQWIMPFFFRQMDAVFCISRYTMDECLKVGIARDRCHVVPCGLDVGKLDFPEHSEGLKSDFLDRYNLALKGRGILLTVGRLSKRKGVLWFIESVMPEIRNDYIYLVVGDDKTEISDIRSWFGVRKISYRSEIEETIQELKLEENVFLLGKIPFADLRQLYVIADIFIMPNISVPGDMEGFGIVAIEGGYAGIPVIASDLEGIRDAVLNEKTGALVQEKNIEQYIEQIRKWTKLGKTNPALRQEISRLVINNFEWSVIAGQYLEKFELL
jgi:glycosyltransferase involved in cell wall biosynthesis